MTGLLKLESKQNFKTKEFKGGIGSLFDSRVNAMGGGHIAL